MSNLENNNVVTDRRNETSANAELSGQLNLDQSNQLDQLDQLDLNQTKLKKVSSSESKTTLAVTCGDVVDDPVVPVSANVSDNELNKLNQRNRYEVVFYVRYDNGRPSAEDISNFFSTYGVVDHVVCPQNRNCAFVHMIYLATTVERRRTRTTISQIINDVAKLPPGNHFHISVARSRRRRFYQPYHYQHNSQHGLRRNQSQQQSQLNSYQRQNTYHSQDLRVTNSNHNLPRRPLRQDNNYHNNHSRQPYVRNLNYGSNNNNRNGPQYRDRNTYQNNQSHVMRNVRNANDLHATAAPN